MVVNVSVEVLQVTSKLTISNALTARPSELLAAPRGNIMSRTSTGKTETTGALKDIAARKWICGEIAPRGRVLGKGGHV
ncbi:hypothetical protein BaRGS_00034207, partial [Batillaria attramentaria]